MTQYLDYAGLQEYTTIVKQKLGELSGRGRYLSNWNCQTGLPTTNPETLPYTYKSGDYFIVSNAYANPGPEHIEIGQLYGDSLSEISVDLSTWKEIVQPTDDLTQYFTYTNVEITRQQQTSTDQSSLYVLDQSKFEEKYAEIEQIVRDYASEQGQTFTSFNGITVEWYNEDNGKILIQGCYSYEELPGTSNPHDIERITTPSVSVREEYLKEQLKEKYGLGIDGPMDFTVPYMSHSKYLTLDNEETNGRWTYLGSPVEDNDLETAYSITYSGTPVIGDVIQLDYITPKYNYRPTGTSYTGTPSETVETDVVKVNDTYLFDGTTWILLNNTSREIVVDDELSLTSTNPVQNKVITEELNKKSGVHFMYFPEPEEESE